MSLQRTSQRNLQAARLEGRSGIGFLEAWPLGMTWGFKILAPHHEALQKEAL